MYYYSKNTGGFYVAEVHGENMPSDVVEIPDELYAALFEGQSKGQEISNDVHGNPVLRDARVTTVTTPKSVTMRQARLALLAVGLLDEANSIIAVAGRAAQIEWEFAAMVEQSNPLVTQLGATLKIDLDTLFTAAAKL